MTEAQFFQLAISGLYILMGPGFFLFHFWVLPEWINIGFVFLVVLTLGGYLMSSGFFFSIHTRIKAEDRQRLYLDQTGIIFPAVMLLLVPSTDVIV